MYQKYVKRVLDILISGLALVILSPVFLVVAILVRVKLGSPVIFTQERPGKDEKLFNMYKFRSMTSRCNDKGELLSDAERLTAFGTKLRSTSLDELPELVNIFKGDMSIIGPRPLLVEYLPLYSEEQKHRHDVRPGLTGLAQVNGRNAISWEKKFSYDLEYVNHITFLTDLKIIGKTFTGVLRHEGINSSETVTMEPFRGNNN